MNWPRILFCFILIGIIVGGSNGVVATTGQASQSGPDKCRLGDEYIPLDQGLSVPASEARVNATISRVSNDSIRFTYHDLNTADNDFGPYFPSEVIGQGLRIGTFEGFSSIKDEHGISLFWDSSVKTPSVTITTTDGAEGGQGGREVAIQPRWGFIPLPQHSHPTNVSLQTGQNGIVLDQFILLGDYDRYERSVGCQTIELYQPTEVNTVESPLEIADSLQDAGRQLNVGWKYKTVRVIGVGSPIRRGGRAYTHEVWVNTDTSFGPQPPRNRYPPQHGFVNVWIHEYVHTRQRWGKESRVANNARWLSEAIPAYYAIEETESQGRMLAFDEWRYWEAHNQTLRQMNLQTSLTNRSTSEYENEEYTRGAFILASLDAKIRSETGGRKSLDDVFYRLNHVEEVNHTSFRNAVVEVGGEEMRPWIERYIEGSDTPPAPNPPLEVHIELLAIRRDYQVVTGLALISISIFIGSLIQRYRSDD